jgi:hypothetical protein
LRVPSSASADEPSVKLAPGDRVKRAQASCALCHSLDYIIMNQPLQDPGVDRRPSRGWSG